MGKKQKKQKAALTNLPAEEKPQLQEKTGEKKKGKKVLVSKELEKPNRALAGFAIAGMVLTAYLALTFWFGEHPLYCQEGSTCDIVQQSKWGKFLGLPIAFWGFITYSALAFIAFRVRNRASHWKYAWLISLVGFGYSIYLASISLFLLKAACIYCLTSFSLMALIFGVVTFQRPTGLAGFNFMSWAKTAAIITVVILGGMHLNYSGIFDSGVKADDPYLRGLAEHLAKEGAVIYGAFW
ncbi:MAG: vitamin K epoxide reductase family protein [Nitrospirae bacterium]|nr:vitamin K epoxide reductase family protein [Nitrospirota bacterium]